MFEELYDIVMNNQYNYIKILKAYRKDIIEWINNQTPLLSDKFYKLSTKIYWILNGITEFPKCKICGKDEHYKKINISSHNKYKDHCSLKCAYEDKTRDEHREQTSLKRYGFKSAMCLPEKIQKRKKTNIKKYGYDHPLKSPRIKKLNEIKYGHCCSLWGKEQREKSIKTMKKNYGVDNPSKSYEIRKKQLKRYYYDGKCFDSGDEIRFYIYLKDHNIDFQYQPKEHFKFTFKNKEHVYYPDFKIGNQFIELKGNHFFREDGTMFCPWRNKNMSDENYITLCELFEAKHQCMIKNNVKIILT